MLSMSRRFRSCSPLSHRTREADKTRADQRRHLQPVVSAILDSAHNYHRLPMERYGRNPDIMTQSI